MQPDYEFDQSLAGRERRIRDLPTFYYHGHFVEMLEFVGSHYAHVLLSEHRRFLDDFAGLSHRAQCLYVRLFNRKGRVFSTRRLRYPELGDVAPLLAELRAAGWIAAPDRTHFDDVLHFLTRDRLRDALCRRFAGVGRTMKKAGYVDFARQHCEPESFVEQVRDDTLIVQKRAGAIAYLSFLYFGRVQDGLQRFTMRDLGLVRVNDFGDDYEPRFGEPDEALEHFYFATRLHRSRRADDGAVLELAAESAAWPEAVWPAAAHDRDRLAYRIGQCLEKAGRTDDALAVYRRGESTRCSERVVRLLLKCDRRDDARQFLEHCIDDPRSDEEWLFANDLYARKFRSKRTSALTDSLRAAEVVELDEAGIGQPEAGVARHFEARGARAWRTENTLWRMLFGLLFWDELFGRDGTRPSSPFDFVPAALTDGSFATQCAPAIDARLDLLGDRTQLQRHLLARCTSNFGTANGLFRWRQRMLDAVFAFIGAAPESAMRAMLERFCTDYRDMRHGYPDLLVIDEHGVRFVEVKTDGDQLRRNQLLKLRQLEAAGFRADIVRVRWTLDPDTTYVVVDVETTGGRGERHRVTEIGAVKVQGGEIVDRYSTLINPQRPIPPSITRLTGISAEMVADAPYFADIAEQFDEFLGDAIFVAHNVEFDYGFIAQEYRRIGQRFRRARLCTCASMRRLYPGHRSYSLAALCRAYDIPLTSHHRALCDAEAAAELLLLVNEKRRELLAA
ncbi:MAG: exonuclease domain-containing protein [Woeseiaceae bacterium]|nr:exonuclease domain-containing protein [Woeseiaceae bacterium]